MAWTKLGTNTAINVNRNAGGSGSSSSGSVIGASSGVSVQFSAWRDYGSIAPYNSNWTTQNSTQLALNSPAKTISMAVAVNNPQGTSTYGHSYSGPAYGQTVAVSYGGVDTTTNDTTVLDTEIKLSNFWLTDTYMPVLYPAATTSDNTLLVTFIAVAQPTQVAPTGDVFTFGGQSTSLTVSTGNPSTVPQCRYTGYYAVSGSGVTLAIFDQVIPTASSLSSGQFSFGESVEGAVAMTFAMKGDPSLASSSSMFLCF